MVELAWCDDDSYDVLYNKRCADPSMVQMIIFFHELQPASAAYRCICMYIRYPAKKCDGVSHCKGCHSFKIRLNLFILTYNSSRDMTLNFVETVRMQKNCRQSPNQIIIKWGISHHFFAGYCTSWRASSSASSAPVQNKMKCFKNCEVILNLLLCACARRFDTGWSSSTLIVWRAKSLSIFRNNVCTRQPNDACSSQIHSLKQE